MIAPKHTPGPWKADTDSGCKMIKGDKHRSGAHRQAQYIEVAYTTGLSDESEDAANAKLIAVAPTMADELEEFMRGHASALDCDCPLCLRFGAILRVGGRLP